MQLHWSWAVLGALALGVALAWWMSQHEERGPHRAAAGRAHVPAHAAGRDAAGPTDLYRYRWVDGHGVVNVSNTRPPAGTRYTIVRIDPDRNVVPMDASADAARAEAR